jgi:hypothetical protein
MLSSAVVLPNVTSAACAMYICTNTGYTAHETGIEKSLFVFVNLCIPNLSNLMTYDLNLALRQFK